VKSELCCCDDHSNENQLTGAGMTGNNPMLGCRSKGWTIFGAVAIMGVVLFSSMAWAETHKSAVLGYTSKDRRANPSGIGFLLNFTQRYYHEVNTSLQENSYFMFRYYLVSPLESFDKRQYIYENPMQANDLAMRALHNAIERTLYDIELVETLRDRISSMTSVKMVIGSNGAQFRGPSFTQLGSEVRNAANKSSHKMSVTSGLTFVDDFRLGLTVSLAYFGITTKLRYYPTSGNEITYTADTPLSSFSKVGLSYRRSSEGSNAVLGTLSVVF
jgi:hypothetical protein